MQEKEEQQYPSSANYTHSLKTQSTDFEIWKRESK